MVPLRGPALALFVSAILLPARATAAPIEKQSCVDAATRGQIQRDDQKLSAAAEAFGQCAQTGCPAAVQKSCTEWLAVVRGRIPILTVHIESGGAATATIDDQRVRLTNPEEGTNLDPGLHTLHVEAPGKVPFDQKFELAAGDKKTIAVTLTDVVRPTRQIRPVPVASWVLGGVAVAGIASFAIFGTLARSATSDLKNSCAPGCSPADRDAAFTKALVADLSLGAGIIAAALGGYLYLKRPSRTVFAISPQTPGATIGGVF